MLLERVTEYFGLFLFILLGIQDSNFFVMV